MEVVFPHCYHEENINVMMMIEPKDKANYLNKRKRSLGLGSLYMII